jgi:two-component system, cell cycle sensor histidine kinase and response regulator CckA
MNSGSHVENERPSLPKNRRVPWVNIALGLLGCVLSLAIFQHLRMREDRVINIEFGHRTFERAMALQREFDAASLILDSLVAFHTSSEGISRLDFESFAETMLKRHSSVQALGYNPLLTLEERAAFEASVQAQGFPSFRITELSSKGIIIPAADRPEYVVVKYIVPFVSNEKAFGFDIYSESVRREALDRARTSKHISATGPIKLVQESGSQMGFLLLSPVYDTQQELQGFMVGAFRVEDLMTAAMKHFNALDIELELLDECGDEPLTLYRTPEEEVGPYMPDFDRISLKEVIQLGGRDWVLRTRPLAAFSDGYRTRAPLVALLGGFILTILLVAFIQRLMSFNIRIQESEEKFRQMAENIHEVFWMVDMSTTSTTSVLYVSPAYERIFGRTTDEIYARTDVLFDCIHQEDRDIMRQNLDQMRAGKQVHSQYRIIRPDGSIRWLRDRGFPIIGPDGPTGRVVGLAEDITMRRQLETERDQLQAKIQQAQKMEGLGVLAGGMAHDYNNLLTAILGHAELLLTDLPEDSPYRPDVVQIARAGERAADLTYQMLAYSGQGHFFKRHVLLSDIVTSMKSLITSSVSNKAQLKYELAENIPTMKGDANQLRQALLNLTINAAESVEGLGGEIRVITGCMDADRDYLSTSLFDHELLPGKHIFVEIADDGSGMDAETLERIFDPFFSTRFVGRGLGLPVVVGIVRGHRGAIFIQTEPGEGTRIRLMFPIEVSLVTV